MSRAYCLTRRCAPALLLLVGLTACAVKQPLQGVNFEQERATREAFAPHYMVATSGEAASLAGKKMFELGGNAIDAAAAISFAISVERPQSTGIGGGGFMMIHFAEGKQTLAVDFRERAPLKSTKNMFLDAKGELRPGLSTDGVLAGAVPGLVAGVLEIHAKYGKLTRQQVLEPAIRLAEEGFIVYPHLAKAIDDRQEVLKKYPASRQLFLKADGTPLKEGDRLVQGDLGKTLRAIAEKGRDGFYGGWVARAFLAQQRSLGGLITQRDLDEYEVKQRPPIRGSWRGYDVYSMPPPSSGGVHVVQILNILEDQPFGRMNALEARAVHQTAAAMQMAFADRAEYLGDSDFVAVPVDGLTSKAYAAQLRRQIPAKKARARDAVKFGNPLPYESDETTHFTVMDRAGNAVASTQTINGWLGAGVVVPQAGFVLNNEMDDFAVKAGAPNMFGAVGGEKNAVAPGKRPLSSMSPTLVLKNGSPVLGVGSPSGTRIIPCVALTILNYLGYKMPLYDAVATVRYTHQWAPDEIRVDQPGFPEATAKRLQEMGYKLNVNNLGCQIQAVAREGDRLHGVADPRGQGLAVGN